MLKITDKLLVLSAYLCFLPALYLILTHDQSQKNFRFHSSQAFFLWLLILLAYTIFAPLRYNLVFVLFIYAPAAIAGTIFAVWGNWLRIPGLAAFCETL